MKTIDWLMQGDTAIQRLTSRYLLNEELPYNEKGYVTKYLDLFDTIKGLWGDGVYGPKWISTHYTMLELKYMEIDYHHPYYQSGIVHLINFTWRTNNNFRRWQRPDICVVAMVLGMAVYGRFVDDRMHEMVDELLDHQMEDGGWNCAWNSKISPSKRGSIHTTLTVLEGLRDYRLWGDEYRSDEIRAVIPKGEEYLLERKLLYTLKTQELINKDFSKPHYPTRWKYDYLRALEYFVSVSKPFDKRMTDGLDLIKKSLVKGYMPKGSQYGGLLHFKLEAIRAGRFNTLRALKVLKAYDTNEYESLTQIDFEKLNQLD
jgi:hypothetical protein